MFEVGYGQSDEIDVQRAVERAAGEALEALGGADAKAGLVFFGVELDHGAIASALERVLPGVALIGATTDGELSGLNGHTEDSVMITLFAADRIQFAAVSGEVSDDESERALGRRLASELHEELGSEMRMMITLLDATCSDAEAMLAGAREGLGDAVPIFGGAAGDQFEFRRTMQLHGGRIMERGMCALGISGPLLYGSGVKSGRKPIGVESTVTRAELNFVYEVDGRNAVEHYNRYGAQNSPSADISLAIAEGPGWESYYIRAPSAAEPETGGVRFLGYVPEGSRVRMTHATYDELVLAARASMVAALADLGDAEPKVALLFSCTTRKHVLGSQSGEDVEGPRSLFGDRPMAGFFTFGEIAPTERGRPSRLHHETYAIVVLAEELEM